MRKGSKVLVKPAGTAHAATHTTAAAHAAATHTTTATAIAPTTATLTREAVLWCLAGEFLQADGQRQQIEPA